MPVPTRGQHVPDTITYHHRVAHGYAQLAGGFEKEIRGPALSILRV
ncbi:MAG TPA: hypothetical protein VKI17_00555 [Gemmataceae bacterium]|nr:hypothetical protein [Gemmataceae bacterium]